ncbi:MAG: flagellin [Planctomycetota bacterium]|jgi:flagellin|nr:flagellin [Planctomycetota bacterium]
MGLRIHSSAQDLTPLHALRQTGSSLQNSITKLSSGLRINRAADDPSGLVISEQLRAQASGMAQAIENNQTTSNLIRTGESALQEISDLLIRIQDSILSAEGQSDKMLEAEQRQIDSSLEAIDRIARSTRFGDRHLFNGESSFHYGTFGPFTKVNVRRAHITGSRLRYFGRVDQVAAPARIQLPNNAIAKPTTPGGTVVIRVTGEHGSEDLQFEGKVLTNTFLDQVGRTSHWTGVTAQNNAGTFRPAITSLESGSDQSIRMQILEGSFHASLQDDTIANGGDVVIDFSSEVQAITRGRHIRLYSQLIDADLTLSQMVPVGQSLALEILPSNFRFRFGDSDHARDQAEIGLPNLSPTHLGSTTIPSIDNSGTYGGFLDSLQTGGANDLQSDPRNALHIVGESLEEVLRLRSFLGSAESDFLKPTQRSLEVAQQKALATESSIRDLDFAQETQNLVRQQILLGAGTEVLKSSNFLRSQVLELLRN